MADSVPLTRPVRAWIGYDIASSTYFGVFPAVLFPIYFRSHLDGGPSADLHWGLITACAILISGIAAPALGVAADRNGSRRRWLAAMTLLCCIATAGVVFIARGDVLKGALAFVVAQAGYTLAMSLYDSYLPRIAPAAMTSRISGLGWGLGFLGGIAAIFTVMPFARGGSESQHLAELRWCFPVIAVLFLLLAVPALAGLREVGSSPAIRTAPAPFRTAWRTLKDWRNEKEAFRFLLAYYLINDALVTVIFFAAVFLRDSFGVTVSELLRLALLYHVTAVPATVAFGWLADRWSHRKTTFLTLAMWCVTVLLMAFGTASWVPTVVVALLATVLGSTQALLRAEFARLVPPERSAEFFGFNTLAGRLSAVFGPVLFGLLASWTGSQRLALLSVILFLAGGALTLARVNNGLRGVA